MVFMADIIPKMTDHVPAVLDYELQGFLPVDEAAGDKETTIADLAALNNHMAMCNGVLPYVRSIESLCTLSNTVCKLIETRRKVKKLEFGVVSGKGSGRTFEVLD